VDGTAAAVAAKAATPTIPIVFMVGADPVELGFVERLGRPGGNMTGVSALAVGTVAKRLQLMHELMPATERIAFLRNPTNPNFSALETRELQGTYREFVRRGSDAECRRHRFEPFRVGRVRRVRWLRGKRFAASVARPARG